MASTAIKGLLVIGKKALSDYSEKHIKLTEKWSAAESPSGSK